MLQRVASGEKGELLLLLLLKLRRREERQSSDSRREDGWRHTSLILSSE